MQIQKVQLEWRVNNMSFLHHGQYYTLEELVQHLEELEA
jgi:hypothetical protein